MMKLSAGPFNVEYNRSNTFRAHDSDPYIREAPKEEPQMATEGNDDRVVKAATTIIKTYFIWKMADRVVAKVLK